jgi:2',3'-cyclic-nucleotide 2'-phosphodiesterase (5'-nucleotidase family)
MISILTWFLAATISGPVPKSVTLLVWSDLHGDPSPHLFAAVDSERQQAKAAGIPFLAMDAGDAFFGSDLSYLTAGGSQVRVLNLVKPDAMVLGDHDFVWTRNRLDTLISHLGVPVLTSNLRNALDDKPFGRTSWKLWNFDGFRVGVIGVVDVDESSSDRASQTQDLRSEEPSYRALEAIAEMKDSSADLSVAISHAGKDDDEDLARKVQGLDLIVGSRDGGQDTLYRIGRTWIARLVSGPHQVRRLDVSVGDSGIAVDAFTLLANPKSSLPTGWKPVFDSLESLGKAKTDSVVGDLREAWPRTKREGNLGNFLADAIREESGSDIGLWPASAMHAGLAKGKVTQGDLWKVIGPFAQVSVFDLPGSEVKHLIRYQFQHPKDFLFLSGITCTPDSSATGGPDSKVFVDGKPMQGGDHYKIAIPQSLRDDIYDLTGFSLESASPDYLERWDRDLVLEHVRKAGLKTTTGRVPAMYGASR